MNRLARLAVAGALLVASCGTDTGTASTSVAAPSSTAVPTTIETTSSTSTTTTTTTAPTTTTTTAAPTATTTTTTTTSAAPATTTTAAPATTTTVDYVAIGAELATNLGCRNCHSTDGSVGLGPSWAGLAGSNVTLADGSTITATASYVEESIRTPDARIVAGFAAGTMQSDYSTLSNQEITALIAYISTR